MIQPRKMSLTALALALGGGLLSAPASAQQYQPVPPAYDAPVRYQEPPALGAPPGVREQQPSTGNGNIQLYTRPGQAVEPPVLPPPRFRPQAEPPLEAESDAADAGGPNWSQPGNSLQIQTDRGIRYVSGGIGLSERDELGALSGQFNLRLMFAMHGSGNYLADVRVRILDARGGVILDATSQGPYFLAQLPPGRYTVEAEILGQTQRQTARVDARQSRLNFYWR